MMRHLFLLTALCASRALVSMSQLAPLPEYSGYPLYREVTVNKEKWYELAHKFDIPVHKGVQFPEECSLLEAIRLIWLSARNGQWCAKVFNFVERQIAHGERYRIETVATHWDCNYCTILKELFNATEHELAAVPNELRTLHINPSNDLRGCISISPCGKKPKMMACLCLRSLKK